MPTSVVAALLESWRAAERAWEAMSPDAPGFRDASIAVLRAWMAYQVATEPAEPGSFALVADDDHAYVAISAGVTAVLGYEPAELLGRRIEDIAAPDLVAVTPDRWSAEMIHVWTAPGAPQPFGDLDADWMTAYLASTVEP